MIGAIVSGLIIFGSMAVGVVYIAIGILLADHLKTGHYTKAFKDQAEGADWSDPTSFLVAIFWPILAYVLAASKIARGLVAWWRSLAGRRRARSFPTATAREKSE